MPNPPASGYQKIFVPELNARHVAFMALRVPTIAAVLAAVFLLARQNDNSPVQIIAPSSTQSAHAQVRVFATGSVVNTGVSTLDSNSRITDALSAAGGVTREVTFDGVNLALRVKGEAKYYVPQLGEIPPATSSLFKGGGSLGCFAWSACP